MPQQIWDALYSPVSGLAVQTLLKHFSPNRPLLWPHGPTRRKRNGRRCPPPPRSFVRLSLPLRYLANADSWFSGSKGSFSSLAKAFMKDLNRPIYALDLRNPGASAHAPITYEFGAGCAPFYYAAQTVGYFCARAFHVRFQHSLPFHLVLMVDDRGGRIAMTLALSNPSLDISSLIICDVAPALAGSLPVVQYLEAMSEIEDPANGVKDT